MRKFLTFLALILMFSGCANKQTECGSSEVFQTCKTQNEQISMEQILGVYEAKIACDGCKDGSKSVLSLTGDAKFEMQNFYIKNTTQKELQSGEFKIENGIIIITNKYREKSYFAYENGTLTELENRENFIKNRLNLKIYKAIVKK